MHVTSETPQKNLTKLDLPQRKSKRNEEDVTRFQSNPNKSTQKNQKLMKNTSKLMQNCEIKKKKEPLRGGNR